MLEPKGEYHCSLVAVLRYIGDPGEEVALAAAVKGYLREHDLRYAGLGAERYLCRKDDRMTVIAPVTIDGIDGFVGFVRTLIPGFPSPFPHVTLLKNADADFGIAIHSADDVAHYCRRLPW